MAEFYQGMVDAANSGNKEAIQESTSRETYERHVAVSHVDYGMSQGDVSTRDYFKYIHVAKNFHKWTGGLSIRGVINEYNELTNSDFFELGLMRLFIDKKYAKETLSADYSLHHDLREILNKKVPKTQAEMDQAVKDGLFKKVSFFASLYHNPWKNSKYIAVDGYREVVINNESGEINEDNKVKGTFNFFKLSIFDPIFPTGHRMADMDPYYAHGNRN